MPSVHSPVRAAAPAAVPAAAWWSPAPTAAAAAAGADGRQRRRQVVLQDRRPALHQMPELDEGEATMGKCTERYRASLQGGSPAHNVQPHWTTGLPPRCMWPLLRDCKFAGMRVGWTHRGHCRTHVGKVAVVALAAAVWRQVEQAHAAP